MDQCLSDSNPPLHPLGVIADLSVSCTLEPDHLQQISNPSLALRMGNLGKARREIQHLPASEKGIENRILGEVSDSILDLCGSWWLSQHRDLSFAGKEQPEQDLDGGRLARSVGAQQSKDLP